jgi:hypothetical protein
MVFDHLATELEPCETKEPGRVRIEEARELLRRSKSLLQVLAVESGMPRGYVEELVERRIRRGKSDQ